MDSVEYNCVLMLRISFVIAVIGGFVPLSAQISIVSTSVPAGTLNVPYYFQLSSYGQPPFTWALLAGAGSLPPGLTLSTLGYISGIPTTIGAYASPSPSPTPPGQRGSNSSP
jgi:hypothetical protein